MRFTDKPEQLAYSYEYVRVHRELLVSDHFLYEPLHIIEFSIRALVLTVVGFELKTQIIYSALVKGGD